MARWEKKALERAQGNILKKLLEWNKKSAEDFAHAEALRDDRDFERRQHAEFKRWEERLKIVIDRLKIKRDNPNSPEAKAMRPLLIVMAGAMKGAYAAGQALVGLPKVGMDEGVFDSVVGTSAGACVGSYFVANRDHKPQGAKVFYDQCCAGEFVKFSRVHRLMDVDKIRAIMESNTIDNLDQKRLAENPTKLFVVAAKLETGESEIIDAKTAKPGPVDAITASMALPLLYRRSIKVNEEQYIDGGFDPLPLQEIIDRCNPTDILILPNVPFDRLDAFKMGRAKWVLAETLGKIGSIGIGTAVTLKKMMWMKEELRRDLEDAEKREGVNIGVLWPPDAGVESWTQNPDDVREGSAQAALDLIKRFGGKERTFKDLNLPKRTVLPD